VDSLQPLIVLDDDSKGKEPESTPAFPVHGSNPFLDADLMALNDYWNETVSKEKDRVVSLKVFDGLQWYVIDESSNSSALCRIIFNPEQIVSCSNLLHPHDLCLDCAKRSAESQTADGRCGPCIPS
jgi:hypothetical protein